MMRHGLESDQNRQEDESYALIRALRGFQFR